VLKEEGGAKFCSGQGHIIGVFFVRRTLKNRATKSPVGWKRGKREEAKRGGGKGLPAWTSVKGSSNCPVREEQKNQ